MSRIEEELTRLERRVAGGDGGPDALLRLGQLYMRADRPAEAARVLADAFESMDGVVHSEAGGIELNALRDEVRQARDAAKALAELRVREARRAELVAKLGAGTLGPEEHDELIRSEVADGLPVHAEVARCTACRGPLTDPAADGSVACARSGQGADLCRHVGATGLYACGGCGLLVRGWNQRPLKHDDPFEPPMVTPEKSRCRHCNGRVADWRKHFVRCPKARPAQFPVCVVCGRRGFHVTQLGCPRCAHRVTELQCMEPSRRLRR